MPFKKNGFSPRKPSSPTKVLPSSTDTHHSVLAKISSVAHVRVSVNDLVAFEYVCEETKGWKWGLGTVAGIPGPRLVQLMLWAGSGGAMPPEALPVSEADRAAAVKRLKELQRMRQEAEEEMEDLNKTLTAKHAHYKEGRAAYEADAARAQEAAAEAREEVKNMDEADWREIRSYVKPPDIVKLVTEAMVLTLGETTLDWNYILKVIRQRTFLKRLEEFDSQSISLATRRRLRKEYLLNPRFTHRDSMEGSRALGIVQRWVAAQLATSEANVDICLYDQARARERKHIEKMEDTLRQRRDEAEKFKAEETRLKRQLGDSPVHIDHGKHVNGTAKASPAPSPRGSSAKNAWSPRGGKPDNGADGATPRGRPGAPPLHENVYSTANTWVFTDESKIVLHSSILVNYDEPASTVVTLTPEQVEKLKKALRDRAALFAEQQKADGKIKNLEEDLENVRGVLADSLQDLADAKAALAAQDAALAAKDREIDEAKEAAAAAARLAGTNKVGLLPAVEPPKEPAGQCKELNELIAALDSEKEKKKPNDKKGKRQGGRAEVELEKEVMANGIALNGSMPALFHARDDRELAKIIDRLEKEIRILRNESETATFVLDGVHATINGRPELKQYFEGDT
ncbi:Microtubule-binding stalk of dynein motor [Leishmania donovani]|uniref:Microtubule-binding_stalk_of_dynein_motor_-_putative n=3 Tax=Leishmania donovani species complex TaxID=38574 RepID=A0A6L0XKP1_LEIIN|nr:conserved hypothetical protein [Leishmania infantum JPCM5]TPP41491.1 Microtubule-binding stalk of dynein motor family protein [Leishmania donovani]CAC9518909.1 Microtubule-binding_stalk_of_dynein_motor_-_putative [Leishmania infantum]CAJ1991317.1 Microtubule-binding stalk of dynein motor [Leishmania donovani]CAM70479.1 conserved hypothetical protein [Leishmania infantum JPCM5]SUZ44341.1 Microtubule-binding_stalk_of_dynein_motor_-_putative [Leishmania infantum]|eukprot:XP_001467421.1 conserved hypothetical protein [Leishmania infantum JPCM5]